MFAAAPHAQIRVGSTFTAIPGDGNTKRFPDIAFDAANNAYLVVTGQQKLEARYVATDGTVLGTVAVVTTAGGANRVACAPAINRCLVTWLQEPSSVVGRFVQFNGGAVQLLGGPFVIGTSGLLTNSAPGLAYAPSSNEFLVVWTDGLNNLRAQRVKGDGSLAGSVFFVANTSLWEGFPTLAYNSTQDEYLVAYYFEPSGSSAVGTQRVKPGTGALIGTRNTLYSGGFNQYPEIAYNSATNQYLAITWGFSGSQWLLRGRLADGNAQPLGAATLALAAKGGGDGIGLGYNPVSNTYMADYQSQTNAETWGVEIGAAGGPGTQIQLTYSGTTLSVQPRVEANPNTDQWLTVMSKSFANITGQLVRHGLTPPPTGCSTPSPGTGYTCVNGTWVPPAGGGGTGGGTATCTTPKPAANFVCVNGNWLPGPSCTTPSPGAGYTCVNGTWVAPTGSGGGTGGSGTCTTAKPAANWTCVNGNWLPPWMVPSSCTTPKPGTNFVCVNGNWLPDTSGSGGTGGTGSCTTIKPGANWTCVNGNWLPPWY